MSNFISIVLLIASLAVFWGYIHPTYGAFTGMQDLSTRSIKELVEERTRYSDALQKTQEIEDVRKGLLSRFNAIPLEDRERIEKLLPDHIDSVRLIIDVNNIASQYDMTLRNISLVDSDSQAAESSVGIGPQDTLFKGVGLKFNVAGSYDNFRSFLRDLEQSLRLVDVRTVSFIAQDNSYDYSVTLLTYKLSQNGNASL